MFFGYYNSISAEIFGRPQGRQLKAPTKSWMCNNVSHVCCFAVAIPQSTMEQVCEKNATKCCTKNQDITAEGNSLFALDVNCCFQFKMTTNAIRMGWRTECVLTFVIVIPLRPICCHETAQSSSTHVPTTRPFVDLEQTRMIAKWFWRKVLGNWIIRKG